MPRLRCVIVKKIGMNKSAIVTTKKNDMISINQLNHKAPEKSHVTEELFGYTVYINVRTDVTAKQRQNPQIPATVPQCIDLLIKCT